MNQHINNYFKANTSFIAGTVVVLGILIYAVLKSYLLFHITVESIRIIIALSIFLFAWNARDMMKNDFFLFLSIMLASNGVLTFIHTILYRGMNVIPNMSTDIPTQIWIGSQYIFALSFFVAPTFMNRKLSAYKMIGVHVMVTALLLLSIFQWHVFPSAYIEGHGLTLFKIVSEYIIIAIILLGLVRLWLIKHRFAPRVYSLIYNSLALCALAELMFTLYQDVYGIYNILGHIILLIAYYLLYKAIIQTGLTHPYQLMFLEIERLSQQKDEFLSIASHELKTPVTSIKAYAQILEKGLKEVDPKFAGIAQKINHQSEHFIMLVQDLLDVSRIEIGKLNYNKEHFNLPDLIHQVFDDTKQTVRSHAFSIKSVKKAPVYADRARIGQVIQNYLSNAIKYSPAKNKIHVKVTTSRKEVTVGVTDQGVGIDAEHAQHVFEKYYRLKEGESRAEGLGLGLYIVKQIIEQHGGYVWVDSVKGKGSTFYFSLPLDL